VKLSFVNVRPTEKSVARRTAPTSVFVLDGVQGGWRALDSGNGEPMLIKSE